MPIYSLWRESDNTTIDGVEARDDAHAVAIFSRQLDVELTLDKGPAVATYMMRRTEREEALKARWLKAHDILVWAKMPSPPN